MALAEPLIEIRGAAFRYGGREVFTGLELDVFRGELLSILGPNGCGKSTLLKCIGGALTLNSGTARLPAPTSSFVRKRSAGWGSCTSNTGPIPR